MPGRAEQGVTCGAYGGVVHVVAMIPAWMLADGEYAGIALGQVAEFGFAVEPSSLETHDAAPGVEQDGASPPVTTLSGVVVRGSPQVPPVLDAGVLRPILRSADEATDGTGVVARGRLLVEPYLWSSDGALWPLMPEGCASGR